MQRLNNQLLLQLILFQVLNHQTIRCFKEDSSLIQILTDTDLVLTLIKSQLIVHIEQESHIIKEMAQLMLMVITAACQTMNQIALAVQLKTLQRNGLKKSLLVKLVDSSMNTLMITTNNQEHSSEKLCQKLIEPT